MPSYSSCKPPDTGKLLHLLRFTFMLRHALLALAVTAPPLFSQSPQLGPGSPPLMPWPAHVALKTGTVPIQTGFSIGLEGQGSADPRVKAAALRTFDRLWRQTGIRMLPNFSAKGQSAVLTIRVENKDHKAPQKLGDDESYSLTADSGRVRITAKTPLGALRGLETFLQLVRQTPVSAAGQGTASATLGFSVPTIAVEDSPRFPWRGLSLDVSRHFIPVEGVRRTLDGMAAVKLNVFHWHLSDDQGFRVESKKFPRLQKFGSEGMYYSQAEIRDVIAYARERGIRVVPEFDMPGHAKSWMPAYPKLSSGEGPYEIGDSYGVLPDVMDPTQEFTYKFLDGFIGEMAKLFPDDYFHIGGDEVDPKQWDHSTRIREFMQKKHLPDAKALQVYFNQRLLKIVTKHGKRMEGWDEILQPNLPKNIVIQSWRGQESLWQAAAEGYRGILSAGYYLDLMQPAAQHYAIDPFVLPPATRERLEKQNKPVPPEPGPEAQKNILGGEAAMWVELATAENLDSRLWPRLAAIAERFWSPQNVTDVDSMYARLEVTNRWLEWLGLTQRSNLRLMRERLAGESPIGPLEVLACIVEPVKGYSRHADRYRTTTPLNRLVDAVPPESDAARVFNDDVDRFIAAGRSNPDLLSKKLRLWAAAARDAMPALQSNALLLENIPLANAVIELCHYGEAAIEANPNTASGEVASAKPRVLSAIDELAKRKGDLLIQIAPGIRKLVEATPVPSSNGQ